MGHIVLLAKSLWIAITRRIHHKIEPNTATLHKDRVWLRVSCFYPPWEPSQSCPAGSSSRSPWIPERSPEVRPPFALSPFDHAACAVDRASVSTILKYTVLLCYTGRYVPCSINFNDDLELIVCNSAHIYACPNAHTCYFDVPPPRLEASLCTHMCW